MKGQAPARFFSTTGRPHDLACGRLVPFPGRDGFMFEPVAGSVIPPQEKDRLVNALESLQEDEILKLRRRVGAFSHG